MDYYYHKYLKYKYKYFRLTRLQSGGDSFQLNKIYYGNNLFGVNIFNNLEGASNLISPLSVVYSLSLLHQGAMEQTEKELDSLFGYKYSIDELRYLEETFNDDFVSMASMVVINGNKNINTNYLDRITGLAMVTGENFNDADGTAEKINDHMATKTDAMVQNIVLPRDIRPSISLMLVSAIYFGSYWLHRFDRNETKKMLFYKTNFIDMMHQINTFGYYENDKLQFVEMMYDKKDYVMGIILPILREDNNLINTPYNIPSLSLDDINNLVGSLEPRLVDLYIPKFIHRKDIDLVPILRKMGVKEIFNKNFANLNLIAKNLYLSKFITETVVIVDEDGTDTPIINGMSNINDMSNIKSAVLFRADHPFIYYIRHIPTNIILFYGDYQG